MRKVYSNDTGEEVPMEASMKSDLELRADGEGGVFLMLCWHEIKPLGSVCVRIPPERIREFLKNIEACSKERDILTCLSEGL